MHLSSAAYLGIVKLHIKTRGREAKSFCLWWIFVQIIIRTLPDPGNYFDKPFCATLITENFMFLEENSAHMFLWALGPGCELPTPWLWCPRRIFGELRKFLLLGGNQLSETLLYLLYPTSQASRYCLAKQELYASSLQVLSLWRGGGGGDGGAYFGDVFFTPVSFPPDSAKAPSFHKQEATHSLSQPLGRMPLTQDLINERNWDLPIFIWVYVLWSQAN